MEVATMATLVSTVTVGGVKRPADVIDPAAAVQVTSWLKEPVPVTVAVHWLVEPVTAGVGLQVTTTAVMVEEPPELPQAAKNDTIPATATRNAHLIK